MGLAVLGDHCGLACGHLCVHFSVVEELPGVDLLLVLPCRGRLCPLTNARQMISIQMYPSRTVLHNVSAIITS